MSTTYTDEDLADLTDAERAALNDPDAGGDGTEGDDTTTTDAGATSTNTDNQGNNDDDEGQEDQGGAGDGAAAAAGDAGAAAGDATADQSTQANADQPSAATQQNAPILIAQAPADAEAKLADIAAQKSKIIEQFDDGDITAREMQQQLDTLGKQEREIERAQDKAQLAAEMEMQRQQNEWLGTVAAFIGANDVYNPEKNPRLYRALDAEVKEIGSSEEANSMTYQQVLAKAHQNLVDAGMVQGAAKQPAPKATTKPQDKGLPPSLHNVPAAEQNDTQGGKWAALDRLMTADPLAYEEALAKMSETDRQAYMAAA